MPARKQYRKKIDNLEIKTISLILSEGTLEAIDNECEKLDHGNRSRFIEDFLKDSCFNKVTIQRPSGEKTTKRTFTFTSKFIKRIKKTGNMSLAVDRALRKKFS